MERSSAIIYRGVWSEDAMVMPERFKTRRAEDICA